MDDKNYQVGSVRRMAEAARASMRELGAADTEIKNTALNLIADAIRDASAHLIEENRKDLEVARAKDLGEALLDRLTLNEDRVAGMVESLRQLVALNDPVGTIDAMQTRPSGIRVGRMRVPIGVIGVIYEARPTVTSDAAALCLKSGNAVILRGGAESVRSNCAIIECVHVGINAAGLPGGGVQLIDTPAREAVGEMLSLEGLIDVIIPRGGKELIKRVVDESKIPIIKHLHGVCHVYVDGEADFDKALAIAVNAKTQRVGMCNTMESLLVDAAVAADFLPRVAQALAAKGVELRACDKSLPFLSGAARANEEDWSAEYLAPILSVKTVAGLDGALSHIAQYGSNHTDAIVTENKAKADRFLREVDSSSVMVNASTRFADGFEYGLGAEMGISTNRLHVRGPVGLEGLTSQKFVVLGDGSVRA